MQFLPPQNQPVCWQPLYHRHFPTQLAAEILHFGASGNRELPELPELPDVPAEFRVPNDIRE